jgi:electron transfer flavoprotein alpha subunit
MRKDEISDWKDVWVFTEIQDHERVLEGSLELLTKGRQLANQLGQKLVSIVFGLDCEQYLDEIAQYGPDHIIYASDIRLKHYNGEIFPDMISELIKQRKPNILLLSCTEAGRDLAPRLAYRFATGLTAHCSDLEIKDIADHGHQLLVMKRPAFSGNLNASILCPHTRPQIATVQQGVFQKQKFSGLSSPSKERIECKVDPQALKVINAQAPTRWNRTSIPLENSPVIIVGGHGMGSKANFKKLYELAELLNGEVGATRIPIFNGWCSEERLIGQTGARVRPDLYLSFGVSGQIQHTTGIMDSKRIISINIDGEATINDVTDYIIQEDAPEFLDLLIKRIKHEKKIFVKE